MFVRATYNLDKKTVHYFDEEGNETLYIGGSFAWRTNNPGNLTKPSSYVMKSAIGYARRTSKSKIPFIIFSDRAAGQEAHQKLLKEVYGDKTIRGMITEYAPPSENDTQGYIDFVAKKAAVSPNDVVGSLSADKFKAVSAAMEQKEGWVPGVIKTLGRPIQVQMFDKLKQPFGGQTMQLSGEHGTVDVRTNANGELPWIYSGLLGGSVDIRYKPGQEEAEHVGQLSASDATKAYTFNGPYYRVPTRARLHDNKDHPRPQVHIVQSGETLSTIAAKYGTSVDAMVAANGLKDANHIYAKQHLVISSISDTKSAQQAQPAQQEQGHLPPKASKSTSASPTSAASASTSTPVASTLTKHSQTSTNVAPGHSAPQPAQSHVSSVPSSGSASSSGAAGVVHQHAPSGHPQTVVSSPTLELSGETWCSRYPGSASLDSLNASFKTAASAFIGAMKDAKIAVRINAALRPVERSYLMYHAFRIAKGQESPDKVPSQQGVNIDWVHRKADGSMDLEASVKAAKEMCAGYGLNIHSAKQAVGRPGRSRHNWGAAVDLNISGYVGKKMKDISGHDVELKSFNDLKKVGEGYGVIYYPKENMHWSDTGH